MVDYLQRGINRCVVPCNVIAVEDEGALLSDEVDTVNFVGGNIQATLVAPGKVDVTVIGAGGSIVVEDEGVVVDGATTLLNFVGPVTAVSAGLGQVDIQSAPVWNTVITAVNRSAANGEFIIISGSTVEITLPAPVQDEYVACKVVASPITDVQIKTNAAGVLIDGTDYSAIGLPLTVQFEQLNFISDGSDWFIW